jgi:hypothetical protein
MGQVEKNIVNFAKNYTLMKRILLLCFQWVCTFVSAQEITSEAVQDSLLKQLAVFPQEKIHLHADRVMYIPGEKIWFKAYVVDAFSHQSPTHSRHVYVELINASDSLVHRVMVRNDDNGLFHGCIFLSEKTLPEGDYTLRAYTRRLENLGDDYFFKKNIRIGKINSTNEWQHADHENGGSKGSEAEELDVSFFPEGGNLVEGVVCRVAFKALNRQGASAFISGEIVDGEGAWIADVSTVFAGMGSFAFIPEQGVAYYLNCKNSAGQALRFKLPAATKTRSLGVSYRNGQHFIQVKKSPALAESPLYLLVHCKGEVFYFAPWNHRTGYIALLKEQLPAGVIQIVLLNNEGQAINERLVFNKHNVLEKVAFHTNKAMYGKREKVSATLNLPLSSEKADGFSHFSIAITDDKDIAIDSLYTITASLLLSSELRGYIESPAYYLQDNADAEQALDLLMMTHGWRRYELSEAIKGNYSLPANGYEAEREMTGSVSSGFLDKPANGKVILLSSDGIYDETDTDAEGRFRFGLDYPDGVSFYVQATSQKGSERVKLIINPDSFPALKHAPVSRSLSSAVSAQENKRFDFLRKAEQRAQYDEEMRNVYLEEIVVTGNRIEKRDEERLKFPFNRHSDMTIYKDEIEKRGVAELSQLLSGISGGLFTRPRASINGGPQLPLVVVNGTPLYWNVEDPITPLDDIRISEVESIDIFKGIGAAVFGLRGGDGVISITTKSGSSYTNKNSLKTNAVSVAPLGYQPPVEFYAPRYDTPESKYNGSPDYRTTIYWKPNLVASEEGKAMFEFYTADVPTTYSVIIEGLTADGKIVRQIEQIVVRDEAILP